MSGNGTRSTTDQKEIRKDFEQMNNWLKNSLPTTLALPAPAGTKPPVPKP